MDKIICRSIDLPCSPAQAFKLFTDNTYLARWLTAEADVEAKIGGKYELFWAPADKENDSTIGCKILALKEGEFLNFEWKGAKQFKHFMNTRSPLTNVTVTFVPDGNKTRVRLIHSGWGHTKEWNEARDWFEKAWEIAFSELLTVAATAFPTTSPVTGFEFNLVYVDDMNKAMAFYQKYFGFEKEFDMDDGSCWGKTGPVGMWIGPKYNRADLTEGNTRTSMMYGVESASALFDRLKADNIPVVQAKPIEMKKGVFWFQFSDPAGNILEVLGGI